MNYPIGKCTYGSQVLNETEANEDVAVVLITREPKGGLRVPRGVVEGTTPNSPLNTPLQYITDRVDQTKAIYWNLSTRKGLMNSVNLPA